MLKINLNKLLLFVLVFCIYLTHNWLNFFYYSGNNVDFSKYFDYVNYFLGLDVLIDYGQGTIYYFLVSISLKRHLEIINIGNQESIISSSVQELNLFLFVIGLIGLYKILRRYEFSSNIALGTLIILNFFPQVLYARAVMKPEIFAFSLFTWCLYLIEKFLESKNNKFLYQSIPFLILIINSKASLGAMTVLYLLIFYFEVFRNLTTKTIITLIVVFILIFSVIQFENYTITGLTPFDRVYEEEFDYKASPLILFKVNFVEIFKSPFFEYDYQEDFYSIHAKSVMNLTLLDTFGDHFNQMFDFSGNYFSKNRKDIFVTDSETFLTTKREINYRGPFAGFVVNKLDHLRKILSVSISIVFFTCILYLSIKNKSLRKFYLAPFVGIIILYLNAVGFPSNNFNPYKGDTFKSFYYSFLLIVSFSFFVSYIFKRNKKYLNILLSLVFVGSVIFIAGHPKENNQQTSERMVASNEYSVFCGVNNILIFENTILKKVHKSGNIFDFKSDCKNFSSSNIIFKDSLSKYTENNEETCKNNQKLIQEKSNSKLCRIFWIQEANNINSNENRSPWISLIIYLSCFGILFKELFNVTLLEKNNDKRFKKLS